MKFFGFTILLFVFIAGSYSAKAEEFNPVDVIDEYFSSASVATNNQQQYDEIKNLLSDLIITDGNSQTVNLPQEIADLFIPANLTSVDGLAPKIAASELTRQLWETTISVNNQDEGNTKNELEQVINKLRSLKFKQLQTEPNQQEQPEIQEVEVFEDIEAQQQAATELKSFEPQTAEQTASYAQLDDEILKKIENSAKQISNPFELAEYLYRNGNIYHASLCYKQALKDFNSNQKTDDKAWILFQLGNCLKQTDKSAAIDAYGRLSSEYPNSIWSNLAKKYNKILNLQLQDRPDELLTAQQTDLNKINKQD